MCCLLLTKRHQELSLSRLQQSKKLFFSNFFWLLKCHFAVCKYGKELFKFDKVSLSTCYAITVHGEFLLPVINMFTNCYFYDRIEKRNFYSVAVISIIFVSHFFFLHDSFISVDAVHEHEEILK